jgi:hypothetical protein
VVRSGFAESVGGWFGCFPQEFYEQAVSRDFLGKPKNESYGFDFVQKLFGSSS